MVTISNGLLFVESIMKRKWEKILDRDIWSDLHFYPKHFWVYHEPDFTNGKENVIDKDLTLLWQTDFYRTWY